MGSLSHHIYIQHLGECGDRWGAWRPPVPQAHPSPHSEGSVIAYFWSEFSIPKYLVEEAESAMAKERVVTMPPRARALNSFVLTSVVAFREYRDAGHGHLLGQASLEQGQALDRCRRAALPSQCIEGKTVCWLGTSL